MYCVAEKRQGRLHECCFAILFFFLPFILLTEAGRDEDERGTERNGQVVKETRHLCMNSDFRKVWLYVHRHVNRCTALRPLMNELSFFFVTYMLIRNKKMSY